MTPALSSPGEGSADGRGRVEGPGGLEARACAETGKGDLGNRREAGE